MLFKDIIGQHELKQQLISSVKNHKISHAQLFLGPLGHGGLPLALAYSQYINCEDKGEVDSCGNCPSCQKAQKFIHPDIHYSYPFPSLDKVDRASDLIKEWRVALSEAPYLSLSHWMSKFNAENKQPNIPIKECHDIIKKLSLKTFESQYKILILWLPEFLGKNGNTLLKIIEEPPERTLFILVAENQDRLLNTIISRTQIVKIKNIRTDILKTRLQTEFNLSEDEALKMAGISNGNYIDSINLLNNSINEMAELFHNWLKMCLPDYKGRKAIHIYQWVEKFSVIGRENQKGFFRYALHFLREVLHMNLTGSDSRMLTGEELQFVSESKKYLGFETVQQLYEMFNSSHYHLERNANAKILLMNVSVKASQLLKQNQLSLT